MSKAKGPSPTPKALLKIRKHSQAMEPLLDADEPFAFWDFDDLDVYQYQRILRKLRHEGAVVKVGYRYDDDDRSDRVIEYEWVEEALEVLEQSLDVDRLPCGHKPHICNPRTVNGLSCEYCREQSDRQTIPVIEPEFSKATVKELL